MTGDVTAEQDADGHGLVRVVEVVPGEFDVVVAGVRGRVLVPAGVGVPGLAEDDVALAVATEVVARTGALPAVLDVSAVLQQDPGLVLALQARVERLDADTGGAAGPLPLL